MRNLITWLALSANREITKPTKTKRTILIVSSSINIASSAKTHSAQRNQIILACA